MNVLKAFQLHQCALNRNLTQGCMEILNEESPGCIIHFRTTMTCKIILEWINPYRMAVINTFPKIDLNQFRVNSTERKAK